MHGIRPQAFLAEIGIPTTWQCLTFAAPFLAVAAAWWLINRLDLIIDRLFPNLEWERRLGWLNIRAQRRAEAGLRWIGYLIYAALAGTLYGIVSAVQGLAAIKDWNDPSAMDELVTRLPVLLVCSGFWLVYLGCVLIPKVRRQHEMEGLEKFRAEQKELDEEFQQAKASREKSPVYKPGFNAPARSDRMRPGG